MSLDDICRKQKFSIIIDESTNISVIQTLAIVVRYFDHNKLDVADALLDMVVVENRTAEGLLNSVESLIAERNIFFSIIIGFKRDNCSTMTKEKNGFQKSLKHTVPSVYICGCICHSFALCKLCRVCVVFLFVVTVKRSDVFSRSSERKNDFSLI